METKEIFGEDIWSASETVSANDVIGQIDPPGIIRIVNVGKHIRRLRHVVTPRLANHEVMITLLVPGKRQPVIDDVENRQH